MCFVKINQILDSNTLTMSLQKIFQLARHMLDKFIMSLTYNHILCPQEKSNKRPHSPNNISSKKRKNEVNFVNIFSSNKISSNIFSGG
mgnify:CR=1 FL=1